MSRLRNFRKSSSADVLFAMCIGIACPSNFIVKLPFSYVMFFNATKYFTATHDLLKVG